MCTNLYIILLHALLLSPSIKDRALETQRVRGLCMPPKVEVRIVTVQLTAEDYKSVQAAAKSSRQTVKEWIASMCHMATKD
jgi:hypothetical protein